jgi:hypothetical protein
MTEVHWNKFRGGLNNLYSKCAKLLLQALNGHLNWRFQIEALTREL